MSEQPSPALAEKPELSNEELLDLKEYQIITPEQEEAMQRIADIDNKIRTLDIIINSALGRYKKDSDKFDIPSLYSQEEAINKAEDELESAYVNGGETGELRDRIASMRAEHEETTEFYKQGGDSMFNDERGRYDENRLRGKTEEQYSEEMIALLSALEELGLSREQFVAAVNEGSSYDGVRETWRVEAVLSQFRSELMLQRNTERLALPDGVLQMSAELSVATKANEVDYEKILFPYGKNSGPFSQEQTRASQLFETLPFNNEKAFSEYPTEVQERFYASVARKILSTTGDESSYGFRDRAVALGKDFSELRLYGAEQFRRIEDIDFEVQKFEKVLEYAREEEEYLGMCFKDDRQIELIEGVRESGVRYDSERKEMWLEYTPVWPIVSSEVSYDIEKIRERGGYNLKEFDAAGRYKGVMHEALQILLADNPKGSKVGAIDIIVAMRKATERVKLELDMVQTEKSQVEMHTAYLQSLKTKTVTL